MTNVCKDCGQELDEYYFTNDEDICDYCWGMRGGNQMLWAGLLGAGVCGVYGYFFGWMKGYERCEKSGEEFRKVMSQVWK